MTDSMKTGIAVGGIATALGVLFSYLCYKEGHLNGSTERLAKDADPYGRKYETLKQKCEEQSKQIQELERLRKQVLNDQAAMKATAGELCNKLRGHVSDEVYQKVLANINRRGIVGYLDDAVEDLKEGSRAVQGGAAKGRVVGTRKFEGSAWRIRPPHDNIGIRMSGRSETRIVFSSDVSGWYFWPLPQKPLLPEESVLTLYPRFTRRIKELIPGWNLDERRRYAELNSKCESLFRETSSGDRKQEYDRNLMDYDFMAICANALSEVEGRTFLCDRVEFYAFDAYRPRWVEDENQRIDLDYENGTVVCSALDEYLSQKCNEVTAAINAFWQMLSAEERGDMEDCRRFFEAVERGAPVAGTVCMEGEVPTINFCGDIKMPIKVSDDFSYRFLNGMYLHFEGDGLYVSTNENLRELLLEIVPQWKDVPISDSRIAVIMENRRLYFQNIRHQKPRLPARGAVREFLRFEDAGKQLMSKVIRQFVGRKVVCQRVTLKRNNGVVIGESSAESDEINQILKQEFDSAQCKLKDFATSRNVILYSQGDLIPDFTDSYYYKKWERFERMATLPRLHVGDVVSGVVRSIEDYGAFIDFDSTSGLLHISEISDSFIKDIRKVLSVGQQISARVISIENGKIGLSTRKRSSANHKRKVGHSEEPT